LTIYAWYIKTALKSACLDVGRISRGWKSGRGRRRDRRWKGWWAVVELATEVADCRRLEMWVRKTLKIAV